MPRIPVLPPEKAAAPVQEIYKEFAARMQFPAPPNFIKTQGHSAAVAKGTWGVVCSVLVEGQIPRWLKEMMFVAISQDRNCRYCAAAHIACCRMLGVRPSLLEELVRSPKDISDPLTRDVVLFGLKCSRNPQGLIDSDLVVLYNHNFTTSEIVELMAMSAFAVYANIIADATGMDNDEMFSTL